MNRSGAPRGKKHIEVKTAAPFYIAAGAWVACATMLPLYRMRDFLVSGIITAAAFFAAEKLLPKKKILVDDLPEPVKTGSTAADAIVSEGREYIRKINDVNDRIGSAPVSKSLDSIGSTISKILGQVAKQPQKATKVRRMMSYYLPTLMKLTDFYATLEDQGIEGENITETKQRIEGNLAILASAFEKQLDVMFEDEAADISADITVLEGMLRQEGLTTSELYNNNNTQMGGR